MAKKYNTITIRAEWFNQQKGNLRGKTNVRSAGLEAYALTNNADKRKVDVSYVFLAEVASMQALERLNRELESRGIDGVVPSAVFKYRIPTTRLQV